jgi:adenosylcobinamide-phosphate synthase
MSVALALFAMLIELALGYPEPMLRAIGHPVAWIGRAIGALDQRLNKGQVSRSTGVLALALLLVPIGALGLVIQGALYRLPLGIVLAAIVASALIAQRSLYRHVADVAEALEHDGVAAGRKAVARIVGRDTMMLEESGIARAAIESLAENFSDGIVAPVFWMAVGGLPGAALYKAINTADSMIGHKSPRYIAFGWAAARLDDLVNLPASRLSALLIMIAALFDDTAGSALQTAWRDAPRHRSPNAGWPEAAMAGALGLSLAGPRVYDGVTIDDARMGDGRRDATVNDIRRALALYRRADAILLAFLAAAALVILTA